MNSLKTQSILFEAARIYRKETLRYSKDEIRRKVNEIKYLASQKKVPKLSLRKEIIHLEKKLEGVMELETALLHEKKREAAKIGVLKREITTLQKRIAVSEDKDLQKKVERLSHLLGERLAQEKTKQDVTIAKKSVLVKKSIAPMPSVTMEVAQKEMISEEIISRVYKIEQRLKILKNEVEIDELLGKDGKLKPIMMKINYINKELDEYYQKHPELLERKMKEEPQPVIIESSLPQSKHIILFGPTQSQETKQEPERELPLPPPPKMEKKLELR